MGLATCVFKHALDNSWLMLFYKSNNSDFNPRHESV